MKHLRFAILHGLSQSHSQKPIIEILNASGLEYTHRQLLVATRHLEILGLIRPTRHQAPTELTAELTPFGKEVLQAA
jgi:predicted MarR family transcription regulator